MAVLYSDDGASRLESFTLYFGERVSPSPQAKIKVKTYSVGFNGQKLVFLNVLFGLFPGL